MNTTFAQVTADIQQGNITALKKYREESGDFTNRDNLGNTLLHIAAKSNNALALEYLLSKACQGLIDINALNVLGQTPAHLAAASPFYKRDDGSKDALDLLAEAGASLHPFDNQKKTITHFIMDLSAATPELERAGCCQRLKTVISYGVNVRTSAENSSIGTALHYALSNVRFKHADILLEIAPEAAIQKEDLGLLKPLLSPFLQTNYPHLSNYISFSAQRDSIGNDSEMSDITFDDPDPDPILSGNITSEAHFIRVKNKEEGCCFPS